MLAKLITPQEIATELKCIPHIRVGSFIQASITDQEIIGINVYAPSSIRKQSFTLPFMQEYCNGKGWKLTDAYPFTNSMQIYF